MSDLHVVLGAGPLGTRLLQQLTASGRETRLYSVTRNPAYDMVGTRPEHIDGHKLDAMRQACEGAQTIYLCLNAHYVDWQELFPPIQSNAIEVAAELGAKLISTDPVYVYGKGHPSITEELAYTQRGPAIGKLRADMAEELMAVHNTGKIRAAIGRYTDFYGPGCLNSSFGSTFGQRIFYPALADSGVQILGNIDLPHTYGYLEDTARGLMTLGQEERALGQVWHLPNPPTITSRELASLVFKTAGQEPKVLGSVISGYFMRIGGLFSPDVRNVADLLYSWEGPFVVEHNKFEQAFGLKATPHEKAVKDTLDWYAEHR